MDKNFIRSFLILVLTCTSVFGFAQRMSVEDFKNFSRSQKVDAIHSMQMFAVNLEKQHFQTTKRKYSYKTLRIFLESIVSTAVANKVIENDKLCIYAGWLSYIPKNSKNSRCAHPNSYKSSQVPSALKTVIAKEHERYEKFKSSFSKNECRNPGKIMCNPQLFGHTPGQTKPFCVDGNPNSENSSFQCLKKVETSTKKEEILDIIINENLKEDNAQRLQRLMSMIDDACMCESPNNMIDQKYAKRMYKTQTCFSWVSQVRNISRKACEVNTDPDKDISSIIDLSRNLYSRAQSELLATGINDVDYTKIVEGGKWSNKNWKTRTDQYKDFCERKKVYTISISKGDLKGSIQTLIADPKVDSKKLDPKGYKIVWMKKDPKGDPPLKDPAKGLNIDVPLGKNPGTIYAKLMKGNEELARSNEIDLSDKNKYEITIAKVKVIDGKQELEATVSINGKQIDLEGLKPYKIIWFTQEVEVPQKSAAKGDKPQEGAPPEKDEKNEKTVKEDTFFDQSSESFKTNKLDTEKESIKVYAILAKGESRLAESNKLDFTKAPKYSIEIAKGEEKDKKAIVTASPKINGKAIPEEELKNYDIVWKKRADDEELKRASELDLEVDIDPSLGKIYATLNEKGKKDDLAKSEDVDFSLKDLDYKISIKKTSVKDNKQLMVATIKLGDKTISAEDLSKKGLQIIWLEKLADEKKEEDKEKKKEKPEKNEVDQFGGVNDEEEKPEEDKKEDETEVDEYGNKVAKTEKEKKDKDEKETDKEGYKEFLKTNEKLEASSAIITQKKIVIAKLKQKSGKLSKSNTLDFMKKIAPKANNQQGGPQAIPMLQAPMLNLGGVR